MSGIVKIFNENVNRNTFPFVKLNILYCSLIKELEG